MRNRKHDIERYLRGELSPAEMHALEKEALNDPFLAEALEGVEQAGADNFLYDLHTIRRSVRESARSRSRKSHKTLRMWGWTSAIAASVLLIAVSGFLVITLLKQQSAREQAMQNEPDPILEEETQKDTLTIIRPAESPVTKKSVAATTATSGLPDLGVSRKRSDDKPSEGADIAKEETGDAVEDDIAALAREQVAVAELDHEDVVVPNVEESADHKDKTEELPAEKASVSRALAGKVAGVESKAQVPSAAYKGASVLVKGRVMSEDGEELPGVNVIIRGTDIGTVTDANGHYELLVPEGYGTLVFAFIGFESQEVSIQEKAELNVSLKPEVSSLSEVVVTGYGSRREGDETSTFHFAEPRGGRTDFKEYLSTSVRYPEQALKNKVEGKVTVRFTVEPDGTLTEFEVIKGIGAGCEDELIRAIKSGPTWQPSSRGNVPMRDQVKVRYRFVLPRGE